jgi:stearoyl-CoA desaturase (Delta-9 desaturase)
MSLQTVHDKEHAEGLVSPSYAGLNNWITELLPALGAILALTVALSYGVPAHAIVTFLAFGLVTGLGVSLGMHRLFSHRSFVTFPVVEWSLMILGCMASTRGPFHWVATHRVHHRHSDRSGDPHSPHVGATGRRGRLSGFWHAYSGWLHADGYAYQAAAVRDLARRPDLAFIDRYWFGWTVLGMALPGLIGLVVGGTAYDALIGFLIGGVLRHFVILQMPFVVNAVCHLWGSRPYDTPDQSRNNFVLGLIALGDGWHNNHHAFPSSARHGFHWWQPDLTWSVIRLMELLGLAWRVKRPPLFHHEP